MVSNTFALFFQDPPPVLTVSPEIIRDHIDGSLSGPLFITLTNGTFDVDMANSVTVNNLPDGIDFEVRRISDTELEITLTVKTGETIAKIEGSQYPSITIAAGKIKDNGSIPTTSALTSNTFAFDIPSDTTIVEKDKQNLKIGYQEGDHAEHVTQKLDLETTGTYGSTITWQSSDETLIANDGTVTRPPYTQGDKKVTLTATITKGQETTTQRFEVIVKAAVLSDTEAVELDKNSLKITYSAGDDQDHVTNKLKLPTSGNNGTTITWSSQPSGYIDPHGEVTRPAHGKGDQTVTLTATIKKGNIEETVTFTLIIKEETRNGGRDSSGGGSSPSAPVKETITIDVQVGSGSQYTGASKATITRTTEPDQTKRDEVHYSASQAQETVQKALETKQTRARLVIPDSKDEVSRVDVQIEQEALRELAQGQLDLEIFTENAKILIPQESLAGILSELYFRVVPIKKENERKQVEERAKKEEIVREALGDGTIQVLGRPMTIETNMTSRKVMITLPLDRSLLPTTAQAREEFLSDLVIFIEHSDGDRVLVKPEIVDYADGRMGLAFTINKFSTFTILNMENWAEYLANQEAKAIQDKKQPSKEGSKEGQDFHQAYIFGYPKGTFQPEKSISRAEMAALLSRVQAGTKTKATLVDYPDVNTTHWASKVINYTQATGLMKGYPDGSFGPERGITRAEMAAIVSRWLHLTEELQGSEQFKASDIQGHWAEKVIQLVYHSGIMKGMPDGTFQPDKPLTRAEAVTILNRILQRGPLQSNYPRWSDVPTSHWAYKEVQEASVDHHFKRTEVGEQIVEK